MSVQEIISFELGYIIKAGKTIQNQKSKFLHTCRWLFSLSPSLSCSSSDVISKFRSADKSIYLVKMDYF